MFHPVSPLLSLFGRPFLSVVFWFCLFWVVFCVCVGFDGSPRCRDFVVFFPTSRPSEL